MVKVHRSCVLSPYVCLKRLLSEDLEEQMRSDCTQVDEMRLLAEYSVPETASRWYSTVGLSRKTVVYTVGVKKEG